MKTAHILIFQYVLLLFAFYMVSDIKPNSIAAQSKDEIVTACKVLMNAAKAADPTKEQAKMIIYSNAYWQLRVKIADIPLLEEDRFFQQLGARNINNRSELAVVISLGSPPRPVKGWTHRDVDLLLDKIETEKIKPDDIRSIIKPNIGNDIIVPTVKPKIGDDIKPGKIKVPSKERQ